LNQTINDKVSIIRESFQSGAADLLEVSGSFRVDFGSGQTVDAKMLRQSLDMMNLKRSSNVRMALTRIFRSALGAAELTLSIHNEAIKLISQNDHEDLRMIKIINAAEFLEPVIGLLYEEVFGKNSE